MTFQQEARSWLSPPPVDLSSIPSAGDVAPSIAKLPLPPKAQDPRPVLVTLLRHCGCPFAERAFTELHTLAQARPSIRCVAVSHSDQAATDRWLRAIGGAGAVEVVVDPERAVYAAFGLGAASFWHVLSPWSLYAVYRLGRSTGIWNRSTESGSRWQRAGSFAVGRDGRVAWAHPAEAVDELPRFEDGVRSLQ